MDVTQLEASAEVQDLRKRLHAFLEELIYPNEKALELADDAARRLMRSIQAKAKERGLWALGLPKEIGGGGLPFMQYVFVNEIVGRSEFAIAGLGTHSAQDGTMLYLYGNPEQKKRWLLPLVAGEIYPCFSMTEPEVSGADPTGLRTRAVQDGDDWVINGHKWFTSGANIAAYATVMCVTDPDAAPGERFSMILVPTDTKGFEIIRPVPVMGEITGGHCEVRYNDVRVPLTNLLGPRGGGFKIAQKRLGPGRIYHCMRWLGQAQRAFELMCQRALSRHAFGGPLADKQTIQNWIADSAAEIQAARLLTLNAALKIDAGDEARVEISLIKFWGARVLHNVIDRAIQVHGALGVSEDTPLAKMYRHARFARIYDGPDEVHRMVVSRRILREFKNGGKYDFGRGVTSRKFRAEL
ncbi:MAG TPA: acyl-CoA dehydrogenase family protein [Candidatus Binataceae bacterium]|nr:acyl-CoA dehydrogenase family protein [Candidatus Binataceae bacterium]